jgi:hypothetical protein
MDVNVLNRHLLLARLALQLLHGFYLLQVQTHQARGECYVHVGSFDGLSRKRRAVQ